MRFLLPVFAYANFPISNDPLVMALIRWRNMIEAAIRKSHDGSVEPCHHSAHYYYSRRAEYLFTPYADQYCRVNTTPKWRGAGLPNNPKLQNENRIPAVTVPSALFALEPCSSRSLALNCTLHHPDTVPEDRSPVLNPKSGTRSNSHKPNLQCRPCFVRFRIEQSECAHYSCQCHLLII